MASAAQLRSQIEATLARRIPSALTPPVRLVYPVAATGIDALDLALQGGLPIGAITEIVGPPCSGRSSLAMALLAQLTGQGKVCAWVDVSDTLHPESAAAAGVDLDRLLWVRCGEGSESGELAPAVLSESPRRYREAGQTTRVQMGGNSPPPRSEGKGLPSAIGDLLGQRSLYKRDKSIGTPGAPNRSLSALRGDSSGREEQVASDRLPARRGQYVLQQREAFAPSCAEPKHKARPQSAVSPSAVRFHAQGKPWSRLDQALRVTDLLLQAGGFSAIVFDMGSVAPEFATRVPLATWFRYRAAAARVQASLLLLTQHPSAKTSAGLVLRLDAAPPADKDQAVFSGLVNHAELTRRRFEPAMSEPMHIIPIRKPPASTAVWRSNTAWTVRG